MAKSKPTLNIIQGFICAGKTTFAKKLALDIHADYYNVDERVIENFSKEYYAQNWEKCFKKALIEIWHEIESALKNGKSVVFDMGFWLKKDRDFARAIANKYKSDFKHYYLYVPDEILKQRIIKDRPAEWAERHLKDFEKNKKFFEEPMQDENAIIIKNY